MNAHQILRFDERMAVIDSATALVTGEHQIEITFDALGEILGNAHTPRSAKSFLVVRRLATSQGDRAKDILICPPGTGPGDFTKPTPELLDRQAAFIRGLIEDGVRFAGQSLRPLAIAFALSDFRIVTPTLTAVTNGLCGDIVATVVARYTNYRGRLRVHLADFHEADQIGHVYFGVNFQNDVITDRPTPLAAAHDLYEPLDRLFTTTTEYRGRLWVAFLDTPGCPRCARGLILRMRLGGFPESLTHTCDDVPDAMLLPGSQVAAKAPH